MGVAEVRAEHNRLLAEKTIKSLTACGFDAVYVENREEALKKVMEYVKPGMEVGFGGSVTLDEVGVIEKVREIGAYPILQGEAKDAEEKFALRRKAQHSDVYITSSNAVTMDGTLLNIDYIGNRVSAMIFGPRQVVVVVGVNKICKNREEGYEYMKLNGCPMNNAKLPFGNPCTKVGYCVDCNADKRACRAYTELRRRPYDTPTVVIIVGEHLGF